MEDHAVNPGNNDIEKLIRDDRRITIDDIPERVGVSHCCEIVNARLCKGLRQMGSEATSQADCSIESEVSRIVTGDETWVHQ